MKNLNLEQQIAVTSPIDIPICLYACAGAGKTTVITERFGYLLGQGVKPVNILLLTFSKKATDELKFRISTKYEKNSSTIATFHGCCYMILKRYNKGFNANILSDYERSTIMEKILKDFEFNTLNVQTALSFISWNKNSLNLPSSSLDYSAYSEYDPEELQHAYKKYNEILEGDAKIDFDDLLIRTYLLLRENKRIANELSNIFKHIIVDEFQDTSLAQYEILKRIGAHGRVFVVGDSRQSIYLWRGARPDIMLDFKKSWPSAQILSLNTNYRSSPDIVKMSDYFISAGNLSYPGKCMAAREASNSDKIIFNFFENELDEAAYVAKCIKDLIAQQGNTADDIAVLYRTNGQAYAIEDALASLNIPYKNGKNIYVKPENKFLLDHLRLLIDPYDRTTLYALATKYRIEKSYIETFLALAESGLKFDDIIDSSEFSESMQMLFNILITLASIEHDSPGKMLAAIKVAADTSTWYANKKEDSDTTKLLQLANKFSTYKEFVEYVDSRPILDHNKGINSMTIHAAKGLEYPIVFLVGVADGLFPISYKQEDNVYKGLEKPILSVYEEERRLAYVATSRAKEQLYISSIKQYLNKSFKSHSFYFELLESYRSVL